MRIVGVEPRDGYLVTLTLDDGTTRDVDLWPYISWGSIYEPLRDDVAYFRMVNVDPIARTIVWPNGADIAPDALLAPRTATPPH